MKKYKLLKSDSIKVNKKTLYRIEALKDFSDVNKGDIGGYIEKKSNLSQKGDAWVSEDAKVYGNAKVYGDAKVYGNAWVYGDAKVYGNAKVFEDAWVYGNIKITNGIIK